MSQDGRGVLFECYYSGQWQATLALFPRNVVVCGPAVRRAEVAACVAPPPCSRFKMVERRFEATACCFATGVVTVLDFWLPPSRTSKRSTDLTEMAATPSHNALLHLLQPRHSHARTHAGPTRLMMLCDRHCRHQSLCSADSAGLTRKGKDAAFCRSKYESTTSLVFGQAESCCSRTEPPESVVVKPCSCIAPRTALNTACGFVEM